VRSRLPERPALPENLSSLWKTDLLLGGASVLPTEEVRAARAGLHLGIETALTVPGRRPLTALIREVQEMPVLTLPLDGAFVSAFNRANASVVVVMRSGLAGHLHPAHATDRRIEQYGSWFGARRTQPVVDIADELLTADPELFTVGDRAVADAADLIAGRDLGQRARRRPLAAVPQARAS